MTKKATLPVLKTQTGARENRWRDRLRRKSSGKARCSRTSSMDDHVEGAAINDVVQLFKITLEVNGVIAEPIAVDGRRGEKIHPDHTALLLQG